MFGLYGLLLASSIWSVLNRSSVTIPLPAIKRLAPPAAVFMLYNLVTGHLGGGAEFAGLAVGFVSGLPLTWGVGVRKPSTRRVSLAAAATIAVAVALAFPLRGIVDVKPEIQQLVAMEDRTAGAYEAEARRFKDGRITADALAQSIEKSIIPELQAADARLKTLTKVPREHQALVASAEEYVRLRGESWRLRADGLRRTSSLAAGKTKETAIVSASDSRRRAEAQHRSNMATLGRADGAERASLEILQRIKSAG
jgi:hypothetical protein